MIVGVGYISIQLFESQSLKEKRRVVRSVVERARSRFNVSVAEVDYLDSWQMAGIGFSCVSNSSIHADRMLAEIIKFFEANLAFGAIADISTELIHVG
ncbi:MAG TPA: DUF503 domain-containing protein [Thermomicrobiales bacterium]|nr:DUF503 domain-containing protein [Chloroflexota bacterium]HQZ88974.1 DUF503 domain-containing protein [Thermomicrobiales bacterium]HRA31904.1 DUF503 domain-containing protein [Thermomicrobiales bacterium]